MRVYHSNRTIVKDMALCEDIYERRLSYGQVRGMKSLIKILKRLGVKHKIYDFVVNPYDSTGGPGQPDLARVRIRYEDDGEAL